MEHMQSSVREWESQLKDLKAVLRKMKPLQTQKTNSVKYVMLKEEAISKIDAQIEALRSKRETLYDLLDEAKDELNRVNAEILKAEVLQQQKQQSLQQQQQQAQQQQQQQTTSAVHQDIP